jgi:hypothetical protein
MRDERSGTTKDENQSVGRNRNDGFDLHSWVFWWSY